MKKFHCILVGLDCSPPSANALREAVRLAAYDDTQVVAVHVIEHELANAIGQALRLDGAGVVAHVRKGVENFITHAGIDAKDVGLEVLAGHPFFTLVKECERNKADLLVMGSRGTHHGINQIGAIAAKCVRKAAPDVLVVKEDVTGPHKRIVACVDLSETSAKAVQVARRIAEQDGAALDCLFVDQTSLAMASDYGGYLPAIPALDSASAAAWQNELDRFLEPLLRDSTIKEKRTIILERMSVREAIIEHIKASQATLVTVGTRGKSDLRTLIMGTTAEKVLQHAPCSILAVKPEGFEYHVA